MKADTHPDYREVVFQDMSCDFKFITRSTIATRETINFEGKDYPLIKIEVQRGVASRIPNQITAREVELGVISFRPNDDSLRSVDVLSDELVLIVSPKHRLAGHALLPRARAHDLADLRV